jgi:hypothetical protein
LLSALRADFEEDQPFCWWDSIDDQSRPALDLDAARGGSDFAADLIALADQIRLSLSDDDVAVGNLAADLSDGLPGPLRTRRAIERLLKSPSLPPVELIDRALVLALGELEGNRR